jgi:hypothetical protein
MERIFVRDIGNLNENQIVKLKLEISKRVLNEIENKKKWKLLNKERNSCIFVVQPHNTFWQFINAFSNIPFIRGNELVIIEVDFDIKYEYLKIKFLCEDWKENKFYKYNLFRKLPGYHDFIWISIKNIRFKRILKELDSLTNNIVNQSIEQLKEYKFEKNERAIQKLKKQLKFPKGSFELLQKLEGSRYLIESSYIGNLVKLNSYYISCFESCREIKDELFDGNFLEVDQEEFDFKVDLLPIQIEHINFLENSIKILVESIINDNRVTFFSIYNEFERAGFFISAGERKIISSIEASTEVIEEHLKISSELVSKLGQIDERLKYSNYLQLVHIYISSRM